MNGRSGGLRVQATYGNKMADIPSMMASPVAGI